MKRYCKNCKKVTEHRYLDFLTQCLIAAITRFKANVNDLVCVECGE